ncbi:hypothetical protein AAMO2058_000369100 [Amorphochlora amoebiformis]
MPRGIRHALLLLMVTLSGAESSIESGWESRGLVDDGNNPLEDIAQQLKNVKKLHEDLGNSGGKHLSEVTDIHINVTDKLNATKIALQHTSDALGKSGSIFDSENATIHTLKNDIRHLEAKKSIIDKEVARLQDRKLAVLRSRQAQAERNEARRLELESQMRTAGESIQKSLWMVQHLKEQLEEEKNLTKAQVNAMENQSKQIAELKAELQRSEEAHKKRMAKYGGERKVERQNMIAIQEHLADTVRVLEQLRVVVDAQSNKLNSLKKQKSNVAMGKAQIDRLLEAFNNQKNRIKSLEDRIDAAKDESVIAKRNRIKEQARERAAIESKDAARRVEDHRIHLRAQEMASAKGSLKQAKHTLARIRKALEDQKKELNSLKKQTENIGASHTREAQKVKSAIEDLEARGRQLRLRSSHIQKSLEMLRKHWTDVVEQNKVERVKNDATANEREKVEKDAVDLAKSFEEPLLTAVKATRKAKQALRRYSHVLEPLRMADTQLRESDKSALEAAMSQNDQDDEDVAIQKTRAPMPIQAVPGCKGEWCENIQLTTEASEHHSARGEELESELRDEMASTMSSLATDTAVPAFRVVRQPPVMAVAEKFASVDSQLQTATAEALSEIGPRAAADEMTDVSGVLDTSPQGSSSLLRV